MEEDRFVEKRLVVVGGHEPVARGDQFPRGFGVVRLIRVPEAGVPQPPKHHDVDEDRTTEDDEERPHGADTSAPRMSLK